MEFLLQGVLRWVEQQCQSTLTSSDEESSIFAAEMAAAKVERMGYSVGFRLCERLAQNKTFGAVVSNNYNQQSQSQPDPAQAVAASQLEAVKFLCKEFWMEVFRKQIENHNSPLLEFLNLPRHLERVHRGMPVSESLPLEPLLDLEAIEPTIVIPYLSIQRPLDDLFVIYQSVF